MVIKSGKGNIEEIKESVKEAIIERIDEYKYLGWWFSEANNIRRQLHEIKSRSGYMVREMKIMGDKTRVGRHDGRIQKMLYEMVVMPTITYNMESTTKMSNNPDSKPLAVHRWQPPVGHWRFVRWFSGGPLVATAQGFFNFMKL